MPGFFSPKIKLFRKASRHDICQNFYTSRFSIIQKFTQRKRVIRNIWDPKYLIFIISIHRIRMLKQFTPLYSHIIIHTG